VINQDISATKSEARIAALLRNFGWVRGARRGEYPLWSLTDEQTKQPGQNPRSPFGFGAGAGASPRLPAR